MNQQRAAHLHLTRCSPNAQDSGAGGDDPDIILPVRALLWIGLVGYPATRVDHRFKDGDTIRVGLIALTAHITGGHTRGCTSWSFPVRDGDRVLNVVSGCDPGVLGMSRYPEQAADRECSVRVLRSLPADIWVTNHARPWGRFRKFVARDAAKDPVDPFIDPEGYRAYIDAAEAELRQGTVH
jgi:metallo-beta-lactamase class B